MLRRRARPGPTARRGTSSRRASTTREEKADDSGRRLQGTRAAGGRAVLEDVGQAPRPSKPSEAALPLMVWAARKMVSSELGVVGRGLEGEQASSIRPAAPRLRRGRSARSRRGRVEVHQRFISSVRTQAGRSRRRRRAAAAVARRRRSPTIAMPSARAALAASVDVADAEAIGAVRAKASRTSAPPKTLASSRLRRPPRPATPSTRSGDGDVAEARRAGGRARSRGQQEVVHPADRRHAGPRGRRRRRSPRIVVTGAASAEAYHLSGLQVAPRTVRRLSGRRSAAASCRMPLPRPPGAACSTGRWRRGWRAGRTARGRRSSMPALLRQQAEEGDRARHPPVDLQGDTRGEVGFSRPRGPGARGPDVGLAGGGTAADDALPRRAPRRARSAIDAEVSRRAQAGLVRSDLEDGEPPRSRSRLATISWMAASTSLRSRVPCRR